MKEIIALLLAVCVLVTLICLIRDNQLKTCLAKGGEPISVRTHVVCLSPDSTVLK